MTSAPRTAGKTCIFQRRKFTLVSFSVGGEPRAAARVGVVEEEEAIGREKGGQRNLFDGSRSLARHRSERSP
jgi:hypothetical protein